MNYSCKNWATRNTWSFKNNQGVKACVCTHVCHDGDLLRLLSFLFLFSHLLLHLHYSSCQTSCLICLIFCTDWCVDICFNTIFHLLFKYSLPKGVWDIIICIQNVNQNRNCNCLFTKLKFWVRKMDCEQMSSMSSLQLCFKEGNSIKQTFRALLPD